MVAWTWVDLKCISQHFLNFELGSELTRCGIQQEKITGLQRKGVVRFFRALCSCKGTSSSPSCIYKSLLTLPWVVVTPQASTPALPSPPAFLLSTRHFLLSIISCGLPCPVRLTLEADVCWSLLHGFPVFPSPVWNLMSINSVKGFEDGTSGSYFGTAFLTNSTKQQTFMPDFCQAHGINVGRNFQENPDLMLFNAFK